MRHLVNLLNKKSPFLPSSHSLLANHLENNLKNTNKHEFLNKLILSSSYDGAIKFWDCLYGQCIYTIKDHKQAVLSLAFHETRLISGSADRTIRAWDLWTGERTQTLIGHEQQVSCVTANNPNEIYSGSYDSTIRQWDLRSGECTRIFSNHTNTNNYQENNLDSRTKKQLGHITCISLDKDTLINGTDNGIVQIRNLKNNKWIKNYNGHGSIVSSVYIKGNRIVSGSHDQTIRLWDLTSNDQKSIRRGFGMVSSLGCHDSMMISGDLDGEIQIFRHDT